MSSPGPRLPSVPFNHWVDGVLLPLPVSGHPALELCNTRAGWLSDHPREYLHGYDELVVCAHENGLLDAERTVALRAAAGVRPSVAAAAARAARALREDLYGAFVLDSPTAVAAAIRTIGRALSGATPIAQEGWHLEPGNTLRAPVDAFAMAALPLLQDGRSNDVFSCPGEHCGWLFHDATHRRRWCIMAICGNRAKARRYAERHRGSS